MNTVIPIVIGVLALRIPTIVNLRAVDASQRIHELLKESFDSGPIIEKRHELSGDPNKRLERVERVHGGIE